MGSRRGSTRQEWGRAPWSLPVFVASLVLVAVIRVGVVLNRAIDPDESQHLHTAWQVALGWVPYRDFWEHHMPAFYYLAAPLTRRFTDSPAVYLAGRTLMTAAATLALVLTWRLARRLGIPAAAGAVTTLALLPQFTETTTETRPDPLALVAWLLALLAVLRWGESRRSAWLGAAGFALGLGLAFSLKLVYGVGAVGLIVSILAWLGRRDDPSGRWGGARVKIVATALTVFVAGVSLALAGTLAWVGAAGGSSALRAMVSDVVVDSWRFVDFAKARPVFGSEIGFLLLAAVGIGLTLARTGRGITRDAYHLPLLGSLALVGGALYLPHTPAVYQHAWLPVLPILAVYAGLALARLFDWARESGRPVPVALATLAVLGGLVLPAGESASYALRDQLSGSVRLMRAELDAACPGEPIIDGTALAVFRPSAHRFGVLITGIREWIARGRIAEEVVEGDLRVARPPVAHIDKRLRGLVGPVADFLAAHYVPADDGLLVAGVRIRAEGGGPPRPVPADVLVSGPYRLTASPGIEVSIDGRPARRGVRRLVAGRHEVTWTGPPGRIELALLGCGERALFP